MIGEAISMALLDLDPIEERKQKMREVKKNEIVKVLKKINIDTVFLLEGVKNEKD